MKHILIIASWKMQHVKRFAENLGRVKGDGIEIDLLENSCSIENVECDTFKHVYSIRLSRVQSVLLKIPRLRVWLANRKTCDRLVELLSEKQYDLVVMMVVHNYAPFIVSTCNKFSTKVLLFPFGSEVIRISDVKKRKLKSAFANADFVATKENSSFSQFLVNTYGVDKDKFVSYGVGSEAISAIIKNKDMYSREEMSNALGLSSSRYNICCGYNGQKSQRHEEMLNALSKNKDILPDGYQIIFPLTYGDSKKELINKLSEQAKQLNLSVVFITKYLTVDELSYLRLITDLFIHVQTTDAANASIQEFIIAGARCINGRWLSYPYLETEGLPYYQCPEMNELPSTIRKALLNRDSDFVVPNGTISEIEKNSYENVINNWKDFFYNV